MQLRFTAKDKSALARQAPEFQAVIRRIRMPALEVGGDLFRGLVESIICQQLAVRAADAILSRVLDVLQGDVTPEALRAADPSRLRACGLSQRKLEYLQGVAEAALDGRVAFDRLASLPDDAVISELVQLRGVGVWTAEMLLIFTLGRRDVLSMNDLGIRNGIKLLLGLEELPPEQYDYYKKRYSPYGTLAALYLWRIKDGGLHQKAEEES